VAGLAMLVLGRVPVTGDQFEKDGVQFEIMDMDGNRVDRILMKDDNNRRGEPDGDARLEA
jgi:putative hemolysin